MKHFITKLFASVMCMLMLFSTTVFAQEDPKAVYDAMMAKSKTMDEGNFYYHLYIDLTDGVDHVPMEMEMNVLIQGALDPSRLALQAIMKVKMEDAELPMYVWYKDGYSYIDMMGSKMKVAVPLDQTTSAMLANQSGMFDDASMIKDLAVRTEGDKRILSYTMDPGPINSYVQQIYSAMGLTAAGITVNVKSITGDYTLTPDSQYTDSHINMAMEMSDGAETIAMNIQGVVSVVNPGQPVQIVLPNPAEYVEVQ